MDLGKGANILAARIAERRRSPEPEWMQWSPGTSRVRQNRCGACGGSLDEELAMLGSLRCRDCREGDPAAIRIAV